MGRRSGAGVPTYMYCSAGADEASAPTPNLVQWCACKDLSNFSPAVMATGKRFSFGASGQVAYGVTAHGGL